MFIVVTDDTIFEDDEVFFGKLVTNDRAVTITEPTATVHIVDNDCEFHYT